MSVDKKLPVKLYKCRTFNEYALLGLSESNIYFASPDELNDPFEREALVNFDPFESNEFEKLVKKFGLPEEWGRLAEEGYETIPRETLHIYPFTEWVPSASTCLIFLPIFFKFRRQKPELCYFYPLFRAIS